MIRQKYGCEPVLQNNSQFRGSLGPISKMQKSFQFAVFHLTSTLDLLKLCSIKLSSVCEKRRAWGKPLVFHKPHSRQGLGIDFRSWISFHNPRSPNWGSLFARNITSALNAEWFSGQSDGWPSVVSASQFRRVRKFDQFLVGFAQVSLATSFHFCKQRNRFAKTLLKLSSGRLVRSEARSTR